MKILVLAALLACVSASFVPQRPRQEVNFNDVGELKDNRFVDDLISAAVEQVSNQIREAGLDPFVYEGIAAKFELPVPVLFSLDAALQNLQVTGISDIVINNINFAIFSQTLTLDISIPEIKISIGDAWFDVTLLGRNLVGRTITRLSVIRPRVWGTIQVNVLGIIGGSLIRSIDLEFELGGITYDGFMTLQGLDYGPVLKNFVSVTIPSLLEEMKAEINELVEYVAWTVVESILENGN